MTTFNQTLLRTTQQFDRLNIRKASVVESNSLHAGQFYGAKGEWRVPFSVSCSHSKKQEAPTYSSSKEGNSRKKENSDRSKLEMVAVWILWNELDSIRID